MQQPLGKLKHYYCFCLGVILLHIFKIPLCRYFFPSHCSTCFVLLSNFSITYFQLIIKEMKNISNVCSGLCLHCQLQELLVHYSSRSFLWTEGNWCLFVMWQVYYIPMEQEHTKFYCKTFWWDTIYFKHILV